MMHHDILFNKLEAVWELFHSLLQNRARFKTVIP